MKKLIDSSGNPKMKLLENKLRKMVREELMKESKRRFMSNINDTWDTPETITGDIANYIIEDSDFEHGSSTAEIVRAIQAGIMYGKRGIKKVK